MVSWIDRVRQELRQQKLKSKDLAEKIGVPRSSLASWMTETRQCKLENRIKIANALGRDIEWLDHGIDREHSELAAELAQQRDRINTPQYPFNKNARFTITLPDDSMIDGMDAYTMPFFPPGSEITIDPSIPPRKGDAILVEIEGKTLFRIWHPVSNGHILSVLNPHYTEKMNLIYQNDIADILIGTATSSRQKLR